jgi:hypothetical protein
MSLLSQKIRAKIALVVSMLNMLNNSHIKELYQKPKYRERFSKIISLLSQKICTKIALAINMLNNSHIKGLYQKSGIIIFTFILSLLYKLKIAYLMSVIFVFFFWYTCHNINVGRQATYRYDKINQYGQMQVKCTLGITLFFLLFFFTSFLRYRYGL